MKTFNAVLASSLSLDSLTYGDTLIQYCEKVLSILPTDACADFREKLRNYRKIKVNPGGGLIANYPHTHAILELCAAAHEVLTHNLPNIPMGVETMPDCSPIDDAVERMLNTPINRRWSTRIYHDQSALLESILTIINSGASIDEVYAARPVLPSILKAMLNPNWSYVFAWNDRPTGDTSYDKLLTALTNDWYSAVVEAYGGPLPIPAVAGELAIQTMNKFLRDNPDFMALPEVQLYYKEK